MELIVGKWCNIKAFDEKHQYIVRYNLSWEDCHWIFDTYFSNNGLFSSVTVISEANLSEIQHFFPPNC